MKYKPQGKISVYANGEFIGYANAIPWPPKIPHGRYKGKRAKRRHRRGAEARLLRNLDIRFRMYFDFGVNIIEPRALLLSNS